MRSPFHPILLLTLGFFLSFIFQVAVLPARAQNTETRPFNPATTLKGVAKKAQFKTAEKDEEALNRIIGTSVRAFLSLLGVLFLGLVVYGGFMWMNAQGNEEDITKAKKMITGAVIGLIIIMGAYAITNFVLEKLETETVL